MTTATTFLEDFAIDTLRQRNDLQDKYNQVLALLMIYQERPSTAMAEYVVKTLTEEHLQHKK